MWKCSRSWWTRLPIDSASTGTSAWVRVGGDDLEQSAAVQVRGEPDLEHGAGEAACGLNRNDLPKSCTPHRRPCFVVTWTSAQNTRRGVSCRIIATKTVAPWFLPRVVRWLQ